MQPHVAVVREDETLALALQLMRWTDSRHLPVVRRSDGRVIGVLSERDVLRAAAEARKTPLFMSQPARELMTSPAEHIHPNAEVADAAADMATSKLGCLPVIDAGELVGIITRADVLSVLAQDPVAPPTEKPSLQSPSVASIMYPEPIAVRGSELVLKLAARMATEQVRHACVVDDEGKVIGIVSDRDLRRVLGDPSRARVVERYPETLRALPVEWIMNRKPLTIEQDEPFTHALPMLVNGRIGALPVVDDRGHLRGIVSYIDMLNALAVCLPET